MIQLGAGLPHLSFLSLGSAGFSGLTVSIVPRGEPAGSPQRVLGRPALLGPQVRAGAGSPDCFLPDSGPPPRLP